MRHIFSFILWVVLCAGTVATGFLLSGCEATHTDQARTDCKRAFTIEVAAPSRQVFDTLTAQFYQFGWGEDIHVQQEYDEASQHGSFWAGADMRYVDGFLVDVEPAGEGAARVTSYPVTRFWARKSRQWLEEVLVKQFSLTPTAGKRETP